MTPAGASYRFRRGMHRLAFLYLAAVGILIFLPFIVPELAYPDDGRFFGALKAGAVMAWQYGFLMRSRFAALRGENLEYLWGWANRVTLARGILLAGLGGFLFAPEPAGAGAWIPAALYAAAAAADFLDGYIAKRTDTRTELGAILDGHLDGIGILLSLALAVQYGRLPAPFLALGLAKPLYSFYLTIHRMAGGQIYELPPSRLRRRLAGFLMGVAATVLWPGIDRSAATLAASLVGIPFLAGFLRDALVVTGRLDPQGLRYQVWKGRIGRAITEVIPPLLRLAAGFAAAVRAVSYFKAAIQSGAAIRITWFPGLAGLPPHFGISSAAVLAGLQICALAVAAAGRPSRLLGPAWAVFLLLESLRSSGAGLDAAGALSLTSVLALFILRPRRAEP